MNLPLSSAVLSVLSCPLLSQAVTISLCERASGFVRAEHIGVAALAQELIATGRCFPQTQVFQVQSGVANGTVAFIPSLPGGLPAMQVQVAANANTLFSPAGASVSTDADFVVQLSAAQPVRGILAIRIEALPSGGAPGLGNFAVDIDDDTTVEMQGDPYSAPFIVTGEFARSFGPGVLPVHVTHSGRVDVPPWFAGEYSCNLVLRWIPDTGAISSYGSGCGLTLREERQPDGAFGFFLGWNTLPGPDTWLLLGFAECHVALPLPPGCTQLTTMDTVVPFSSPGVILPWLPLPTGLVVQMQAVQFASLQSTLTSNGLRLVVGP
jgi:hypothetical protein